MDEDEDTYGFGSFSDLFDAGPATSAKRLDLNALSRFCTSERKLMCFQQQQHKRFVVFQHVAAKFNGVGIDGGLGTLEMVPLEAGGGFLWLQKTQSDTDARGRRKKELQDITNRQTNGDDHPAADALYIPTKCVTAVRATTLQNIAQGVEIKLMDGDCLEFTFMPGPYANSAHRNEFLQALEHQTRGSEETQMIPKDIADKQSEVMKKRKTQVETEATRKEMLRQLVRRYTELDPMTEEAFRIANEVHTKTGYYLGPRTKQMPKFSEDSKFREHSLEQLANYLKRMKQEGKEADAHRELNTRVKYVRTKSHRFEYSDIDTGALISPQTYEQRYIEYVQTHEVLPDVHELPSPYKECRFKETDDVQATVKENARSVLMATMGIDISTSRVIDHNFFSRDIKGAPSGAQTCKGDEALFRYKVDTARTNLWHTWRLAWAQVPDKCPKVVSSTQSTRSLSDQRTRRNRPRKRSQSLVVQPCDELHASGGNIVAESSATATALVALSSDATAPKSRTKRSRATAYKRDTVKKARRLSATQEIMNSSPQSGTEDKVKTSLTWRPKHRTKRYSMETSSLEMVAEVDSSLCQLCYSEEALVQMKPCDHTVCSSCWSRLSLSSGKNGTGSRRLCPWDREVISKR